MVGLVLQSLQNEGLFKVIAKLFEAFLVLRNAVIGEFQVPSFCDSGSSPLLILLSIISNLVFLSVYIVRFMIKYAFIASSHWVASSFLPKKSSGSLGFISEHVAISLSSLGGDGGRGAGSKDSSSSLVISMSGSGTGDGCCSGMVAMVRGRGSSAACDSYHGGMFRFL